MKYGFYVFFILLSIPFLLHGKSGDVVFTSSNLPIIILNTSGQEITDNVRIVAEMSIISNAPGVRNYITDPANNYNGRIEIELHGQSSLSFPKKSYRLETQDASGENQNVSLLGMPKENDWILYAPYSDKSLMRNVLIYSLAAEMGAYAPRVKYCELVLNREYRGIYVLTEKIKQDKNRVNITEMSPQDISGPAVSGGYIFKKDKTNPGDNIISLDRGVELIITEPKNEDIVSQQTAWLRNYLNDFDQTLINGGDYSPFIDVPSFVDNFLMVEFAKNIDGLRLSTYFYKDREGKIIAGPVWDYNLALGNADYNDGWTAIGWYYPLIEWDNNWWEELLKDQVFYSACIERWKELRLDILNEDQIFNLIDDWQILLEESQARNFEKFPTLGTYVWPNPGYPESGSYGYTSPTTGAPTTWEGEVHYLKNFISERLKWIDEQYDVSFSKISVALEQPGQGNILLNNKVITGNTDLGNFLGDTLITLRAEPLSGHTFKQWEEIIPQGQLSTTWIGSADVWKYLDNGSNQGSSWRSDIFDDSNWQEGRSELGYGDNDEATVVSYGGDSQNKHVTTYFRKRFTVIHPELYNTVTLNLLRDDGAVVYLNGTEIVRSNMPESIVGYTSFAVDFVDGNAEKTWYPFTIEPSLLWEGQNTIAVEIHQQNLTSSDISFNLQLSGIRESSEVQVNIIGTNQTLTYLPWTTATLRAVFSEKPAYQSNLVINEILYHDPYNTDLEFIELYNNTDSTIDFSGYTFSSGIEFTFPEGTAIDAGKFTILAKDTSALGSLTCRKFQWAGGALSDSGELLLLVDSTGSTVDSVDYSTSFPWPETNGDYSIELKNASLDNALPESWQVSYKTGGSPGKTTMRRIAHLYINEFLASNTSTIRNEKSNYEDWIELYNGSDQPVDVGGLFISDDQTEPEKWQIPVLSPFTTTIEADSFLLLWADSDTALGILHLPFNLGKSGEDIILAQIVDNETAEIDVVSFDAQIADISMARIPDGSPDWQLTNNPTPGYSNGEPTGLQPDSRKPWQFGLHQNYPNPFNPTTKISYTVGSGEKAVIVSLKVYDILGREVLTLVNRKQPAGNYTVAFDATGLASGIYLYRIEAGSYHAVKKMILIR